MVFLFSKQHFKTIAMADIGIEKKNNNGDKEGKEDKGSNKLVWLLVLFLFLLVGLFWWMEAGEEEREVEEVEVIEQQVSGNFRLNPTEAFA